MRRAAIITAVAVYAFALIRYGCYAAGRADSSGYLNFAKLLARGEVLARVTPLDTLALDASWDDTREKELHKALSRRERVAEAG